MTDDLTRFGYAPGNYSCRCQRCKSDFIGDKRASTCEPCARSAIDSAAPAHAQEPVAWVFEIGVRRGDHPTLPPYRWEKHVWLKAPTNADFPDIRGLTPLYASPPSDRLAEMTAEIERLRDQKPVAWTHQRDLEQLQRLWPSVYVIGVSLEKTPNFPMPLYASPASEEASEIERLKKYNDKLRFELECVVVNAPLISASELADMARAALDQEKAL